MEHPSTEYKFADRHARKLVSLPSLGSADGVALAAWWDWRHGCHRYHSDYWGDNCSVRPHFRMTYTHRDRGESPLVRSRSRAGAHRRTGKEEEDGVRAAATIQGAIGAGRP